MRKSMRLFTFSLSTSLSTDPFACSSFTFKHWCVAGKMSFLTHYSIIYSIISSRSSSPGLHWPICGSLSASSSTCFQSKAYISLALQQSCVLFLQHKPTFINDQ